MLKVYWLNPCHYFSSPRLSWVGILKMTVVKLGKNLIGTYLFIEKGMRGGISYIVKRCSEANKKYMKIYDPKKYSKCITYLDMNNLYGWAMSCYLFNLANGFDINSISEKSPIGCIQEVDFEYPDEIHVLHNDYQIVPEKVAISYDMLSDYCKKIAEEDGIIVGDVMKLIPNFGNKTNYVLHYRDLQLYFSLGMKLTKFHKVLKFKQFEWMKKYIICNTEK